MFKPVKACPFFVNARSPQLPVPEQIIKRMATIGAEVNVIGAIVYAAAAVVPKIKRIEVLVL
jgi:hypothetical protein